ncbi:MAG: hypothetical protein ACI8S6_003609 [Myxococcota bacterium]|jgi:hypothetical protein
MRSLFLLMVPLFSLVGCDVFEEEEVPDLVFGGSWGGQCTFDIDGYASEVPFTMEATFDDAKSKVEGTGAKVVSGEGLPGTLTGSTSGNDVDLELIGEGKTRNGSYYSYTIGMSGTYESWWVEGTCWNSVGDTGTLFMRN